MTLQTPPIKPARFEDAPAFTIAGLGERYSQATLQKIPALWQRFERYIGQVPGQEGEEAYGVCCNGDGKGNFDYIAGVQVQGTDLLPADFQHVELKARRYAVFEHHGSLDNLKVTFEAIWKDWVPVSGETVANAPEFERYGKDFSPYDSNSVMEIWLPLESK
ncbi:GyrI-like domain-containing protein [Pseudomonas rubra]|uniref:GyrI-like domain-containing protein n=1 Tax=Pseudomonas rubra TaxID=2942627 RepID=A0ABT5P3J0_9PSED|nr:GyrI-like domain-containing protein [Pseudomonas rubra]MDD1012848.1 GyrI-like domain-containing protein [Pseudomonas rubra]MDD1036820.1 GyrI-like domain-containing protein [Pseudomonas rubra]MDD1157039.1 GyrI-like domain-containing protein [Pseudomonas rubra]